MRTYQYDPGRTFRGWLRQFCHSRAVDLIRKRRTELARFVDDQPADELLLAVDMFDAAEDEDSESRRSLLLSQAEQVQHAVKERVEPQTWQAFWRIAVEGCSFRETADGSGNVLRGRVRGAQAGGTDAPRRGQASPRPAVSRGS